MKAFRKSWDFSLTPKAKEDQYPISKQLGRRYSVLFMGRVSAYLGLYQIGWGLPISGKAIWFTQSTNSNVNLIYKLSHRHTQNHIWSNIQVPHAPVKLIHKINPHSWLRNICLAKSSHTCDGKIRTILEIQGKNYYILFLRYLFK